jgi:hypothetical protein
VAAGEVQLDAGRWYLLRQVGLEAAIAVQFARADAEPVSSLIAAGSRVFSVGLPGAVAAGSGNRAPRVWCWE